MAPNTGLVPIHLYCKVTFSGSYLATENKSLTSFDLLWVLKLYCEGILVAL